MSATNRGSHRVDSDFYPTPIKAVDLILEELHQDSDISFLEPCRGNRVIYDRVPYADKQWAELSDGVDYLKNAFSADLIVSNPPFSLAQEFIEKSLKEASTVVYLLRLNFLGSQSRYDFWQKNPPTHIFVLSERPAFVSVCKGYTIDGKKHKGCGKTFPLGMKGVCDCGGKVGPGTDATEYAWFCWDRGDIVKRPSGIYVI